MSISSSTLLVNEILHTFLVKSDIEESINHSLKLTGEYFHVSRVCVFQNSLHEFSFSNTHEWCQEGIPSKKEFFQHVPFSLFNGYYHFFDAENIFAVKDTSTLPAYFANGMEKYDVKAFLQAAFVIKNKKIGMICLNECNGVHEWSDEEKNILSQIAGIFTLFLHDNNDDRLSKINAGIAFKMLDSFAEYIYAIDVETCHLLYANRKILEAIPELELGKSCYAFFTSHSHKRCSFCPISVWEKNPSIIKNSFALYNKITCSWMLMHSAIVEWLDGRKICFLTGVNITEQRQHDIMLHHLAYTDDVTGLPNRRAFEHKSTLILDTASRKKQHLAMIVIRIDGLYHINRMNKNILGDNFIRSFSRIVNQTIPRDTLFSRIRGNHFALLYHCSDNDYLEEIIDLFENIKQALKEPNLDVQGNVIFSAGISFYPDDGNEIQLLYRKAELALKSINPNNNINYAFYNVIATADQFVQTYLAKELLDALHHNEMELYYQPKINVQSSRICGVEALVRWHHPEYGLLPGGAFLRAAEEHNLIATLDDWVINEACRHIKMLRDTGCRPVPIAINLSIDEFYQDDLLTKISSALKRYSVPPDLLEVELTEQLAMENSEKAISIMHQMRALGVHIAIDGFGTGYFALNYLKMLPVDALKLSPSFSREKENPISRQIVSLIVRLAGFLKAKLVMEGVETAEQFDFAKKFSFDVVQGYFTGRPVPLNDIAARLATEERQEETLRRINVKDKKFFLPQTWSTRLFIVGGIFLIVSLTTLSIALMTKIQHLVAPDTLLWFLSGGVIGVSGAALFIGWRLWRAQKSWNLGLIKVEEICHAILGEKTDIPHTAPEFFQTLGEILTRAAQKLQKRHNTLFHLETSSDILPQKRDIPLQENQ